MGGGRKKKSSSSKKQARRNKRGKGGAQTAPPDLDALLSQADAAMDSSDVPAALALYVAASSMLRAEMDSSAGARESGVRAGGASGTDDDGAVLLSGILGKIGEARVSMGDREGALGDFAEAVSLLESKKADARSAASEGAVAEAARLRETRAGLHLYVGQLSTGEDALRSYRRGIDELEACAELCEGLCHDRNARGDDAMGEGESPVDAKEFLLGTRRQMCGAYCSVAELYLTDLCYDPDAEAQCESSVRSALELKNERGEPHIDALQAMANLRLSQSRGSDAVPFILDAYGKIKDGCEALSSLVGLGTELVDRRRDELKKENGETGRAKELVDVDAANSLPGFEFRVQSVKILLECDLVLKSSSEASGVAPGVDSSDGATRTSCVEAAIQILGSLLAENDEVIEIWYLLGCAFAACDPPNVKGAEQYWDKSMEMLTKVKEGLERDLTASKGGGGTDAERGHVKQQLDDVLEQIEEVESKLGGLTDTAEDQEMEIVTDSN